MVTQIIDDISCIRILFDDKVFIVNKAWIRTIETVQADTVKIDMAAGPLKHIYVKFSEVSLPAGLADVNALRDAIKAMLDISTASADIAVLGRLSAVLQKMALGNGINVNVPSITDETVPNVVYYGYASGGGVSSMATWAVNQVTSNKGIVTSLWANGNAGYDNIWDARYTLKYELIGTAATS